MMCYSCFVPKPEANNNLCEDACMATSMYIALSDGAGGGGVLADRWARYLVEHTSQKAIDSFEAFSAWMDEIWEPFYKEAEAIAKEQGGMFLNKFYEEGSYATYVAAWRVEPQHVRWMAYGDSAVFLYDFKTQNLQCSFPHLSDFAQAPYLVNCPNEPQEEGFSTGVWELVNPRHSAVFACSDALAHYVLASYLLWKGQLTTTDELSKNINLQHLIEMRHADFQKDVLRPLLHAMQSNSFADHCRKLYRGQFVALDDYSMAVLQYNR